MNKRLFIAVSATLFLSACGGGAGGSENLLAAYDRILKGMTPDQVVTAVGSQPAGRGITNGITLSMIFSSGNEAITVGFENKVQGVVIVKSYAGNGVVKSDNLK